MPSTEIVTREEWLTARKELLAREKEFSRQRDELSRQRRELPWVKVEKNYIFDGPDSKETLADLFDGHIHQSFQHRIRNCGDNSGDISRMCTGIVQGLDNSR